MLNSFKFVLFVALVGFFAVSCASDSDAAAKDAARAEIATAPNATTAPAATANPATPAEPAAPKGPSTTMAFAESSFDFGTVESGEKVRHTYKFTNTGKEPLVISNAKGSCGCTVPKWPQEPIAPGAEGEIDVEFDSKNKAGRQTKTVTITANTESGTERLTITGEVLKDPNAPAPAVAAQPGQPQQIQINQ